MGVVTPADPIPAMPREEPEPVGFGGQHASPNFEYASGRVEDTHDETDKDWIEMGRAMNGPISCNSNIPKGLKVLKQKAVARGGVDATIADLAKGEQQSVALPEGLLEALAAQHQQQQQQLELTQPTQAATLSQPEPQPTSGMPPPSDEQTM